MGLAAGFVPSVTNELPEWIAPEDQHPLHLHEPMSSSQVAKYPSETTPIPSYFPGGLWRFPPLRFPPIDLTDIDDVRQLPDLPRGPNFQPKVVRLQNDYYAHTPTGWCRIQTDCNVTASANLFAVATEVWALNDTTWQDTGASNEDVDPTDHKYSFGSTSGYLFYHRRRIGEDPELLRSTDGVTWTVVWNSASLTLLSFAIGTNQLAVGVYNNSLNQNEAWYSDDFGANWTKAFDTSADEGALKGTSLGSAIAVNEGDTSICLVVNSVDVDATLATDLRFVAYLDGTHIQVAANGQVPYAFENAAHVSFDDSGNVRILWHHEDNAGSGTDIGDTDKVFLSTIAAGVFAGATNLGTYVSGVTYDFVASRQIVRVSGGYVAVLSDTAYVNGASQALPQSGYLLGMTYNPNTDRLYMLFHDGGTWQIDAPATAWAATHLTTNDGIGADSSSATVYSMESLAWLLS